MPDGSLICLLPMARLNIPPGWRPRGIFGHARFRAGVVGPGCCPRFGGAVMLAMARPPAGSDRSAEQAMVIGPGASEKGSRAPDQSGSAAKQIPRGGVRRDSGRCLGQVADERRSSRPGLQARTWGGLLAKVPGSPLRRPVPIRHPGFHQLQRDRGQRCPGEAPARQADSAAPTTSSRPDDAISWNGRAGPKIAHHPVPGFAVPMPARSCCGAWPGLTPPAPLRESLGRMTDRNNKKGHPVQDRMAFLL